MKFEKVTENKIRITFNLDDLSENNIDFHSFMANSVETQALFLDMLEKAEKEIGFVTKNYRLAIEVLATSNGNFILTVTRSLPEGLKVASKKIRGKRKTTEKIHDNSKIYIFNNFDDICNACHCLDDMYIKEINTYIKKSTLYSLNNKYYLIIKSSNINANLHLLYYTFSEFGNSYKKYSNLLENKLIEYGNIIIKNNVIEKIKKYFNKT